jgi:hypothetical protein
VFAEAHRSSPISLSGKNPQNGLPVIPLGVLRRKVKKKEFKKGKKGRTATILPHSVIIYI